MKRSGWRTLLTAVVAAAALVVSGGAASAATGGGHGHGLRPEKFTIKIINGADGKVKAFGPVHGRAVDKEMSDTRAVFDFGHGNTVNVWHSAVSVQPKVDPKSCKATAYTAGDSHFVGEHTYFTRHGQRIPYAWVDDTASLFTATQKITHELVEAITDPEDSAVLGVAGTCRQKGWCEIADICPDPLIVDGVAAATYWSNQAGGCIAPDRASASGVPDAYASRGSRQLP